MMTCTTMTSTWKVSVASLGPCSQQSVRLADRIIILVAPRFLSSRGKLFQHCCAEEAFCQNTEAIYRHRYESRANQRHPSAENRLLLPRSPQPGLDAVAPPGHTSCGVTAEPHGLLQPSQLRSAHPSQPAAVLAEC